MLPPPTQQPTSLPQLHKGCCLPSQAAHCRLPRASSKRAWETFSRPNRILSCWIHTWQEKNEKEETKL
jgi:hypothetical protein